MSSIRQGLRWFFFAFILVSLIYVSFNIKMFVYLIAQAKGQYHIISQSVPTMKALTDSTFSKEIKEKIHLINQIKHFAEEDLKLRKSENYTTFFLHSKPLVWLVTACVPYALKPYQWSFPFFGNFPYLGFFEQKMANDEKDFLLGQGYDVGIRNPIAWSTLGWFKDPIFSGFLRKRKGEMADLIIHELFHQTLYIKDSIQLNENLASFIGGKGAILFLKKNYTKDDLKKYKNNLNSYISFKLYTLKKANELKKLYNNPTFTALTIKHKEKRKKAFFQNYIDSLCFLPFGQNYYEHFKEKKLNNTHFLSYLRYHNQGKELKNQLENQFSNNLVHMIHYYKVRFAE